MPRCPRPSRRSVLPDVVGVVGGIAVVAMTWNEARRPELPPWEGPAFDAVNHLPDAFRATWPIMQLGSFLAIPALTAATARLTHDPRPAAAVGAAGLGAYVAAKVIKRRVGRGRPATMRPGARLRENASGLGYPSGHAAESAAMATVFVAQLHGPLRVVPPLLAAVVGLSRVHVGAHLPHDVIYRPKTGFGAPLRRWMRHELREHFEHALAPDTIRRRGIFDAAAVEQLVQRDRAGRIDAAYPLFGLVCIETWCRRFVDAPSDGGVK